MVNRPKISKEDPRIRDLAMAVEYRKADTVRQLLAENEGLAVAEGEHDRISLHHIAKTSLAIVEMLFDSIRASDLRQVINSRDAYGFTPVHNAARGEFDVLKLVLDNGGYAAVETPDKWTALHSAANPIVQDPDTKNILLLLKSGTDPTVQHVLSTRPSRSESAKDVADQMKFESGAEVLSRAIIARREGVGREPNSGGRV